MNQVAFSKNKSDIDEAHGILARRFIPAKVVKTNMGYFISSPRAQEAREVLRKVCQGSVTYNPLLETVGTAIASGLGIGVGFAGASKLMGRNNPLPSIGNHKVVKSRRKGNDSWYLECSCGRNWTGWRWWVEEQYTEHLPLNPAKDIRLVGLSWDTLHPLARQEIALGAGFQKKIAEKRWSELDDWIKFELKNSLIMRSKGTSTLKTNPFPEQTMRRRLMGKNPMNDRAKLRMNQLYKMKKNDLVELANRISRVSGIDKSTPKDTIISEILGSEFTKKDLGWDKNPSSEYLTREDEDKLYGKEPLVTYDTYEVLMRGKNYLQAGITHQNIDNVISLAKTYRPKGFLKLEDLYRASFELKRSNPFPEKTRGLRKFGTRIFHYAGRTIYPSKAYVTVQELKEKGIETKLTRSKGAGTLLWTSKPVWVDLTEPIYNPTDEELTIVYIELVKLGNKWTVRAIDRRGESRRVSEHFKRGVALRRAQALSDYYHVTINTPNPMTKIHPEALESLKRYKDDLKAGHADAAEYWRGQAAAYFTSNPSKKR